MKHSNVLRATARRTAICALMAASALLIVCGSAFASTATLGASKILYYTAATTGEVNNVSVSISGSNFVLTDSTATISSETGPCTIGGGGHTLTCPSIQVNAQTIRLYDQNDSYINSTSTVGGNIYAGVGNDNITGGFGSASGEVLRGEDGNDTLSGRDGNDTLMGGEGTDSLDGGLGADVFYGQGGSDTITYASRTAAVFVSLDPTEGPVGELAEYDQIMDNQIERAQGGSGNDTLWGGNDNGLTNTLTGNGGNDVITAGADSILGSGGAGNDVVTGGAGDDELVGGNDNDVLDSRGGGQDITSAQGGDDLTYGDLANGSHYAGTGSDTISYAHRSNPLFASFEFDYVQDESNGALADSIYDFRNFVGGSANDEIFIQDGLAGHAECGAGQDYVSMDAIDTIDEDCESFSTP